MSNDTTRPDEIEPMVPILSCEHRTDGGARPSGRPGGRERPPRTDYATAYTRDAEEIEPMVPDIS